MRVVAESRRPLKKSALKALIVSVAISALLGVLALVTDDFGKSQAKVLLTAMTVAGASIIALACGAALELGRARLYAPLGIWSSVIGAALALLGIWIEISDEVFIKVVCSAIMIAVFAGHASAMSTSNLLPKHAWVRLVTIGITALLLVIFMGYMWPGERAWREMPWKLVGVLIVLASAGTIMVPVLTRMGRDEFQITAEAFGGLGDEDIEPGAVATPTELPHCPHCGEQLPASLKRSFP